MILMFTYLLILANVCATNCLLLQQEQLAFGHRQVEAVIRDRPEMGVVINRESSLRAMLELSFAGQSIENHLYWNSDEPSGGLDSSNVSLTVRVSRRTDRSAVDKCTELLFELHDAMLEDQFDALDAGAIKGQVSRDDFATYCIALEYRAFKKTQEYLRKHPLTGADSKENPYYHSMVTYDGSFSDYLKWVDRPDQTGYNVRRYFLRMYDDLISAPRGSRAAH
jgi:hypothetical protein